MCIRDRFSARVNRNFVYISDSNSFPVAFNVSAFTMDGGPILKDLYNEKDTVLDESNIEMCIRDRGRNLPTGSTAPLPRFPG